METVTIQIKHSKAYKLLKDLEALEVIKVLKKKIDTKEKLSEKYIGKIPSQVADQLKNHTQESRNEWER